MNIIIIYNQLILFQSFTEKKAGKMLDGNGVCGLFDGNGGMQAAGA